MNKPSLATPNKNISLTINGVVSKPVKRTVVVLGVERGGTSMAAGIVRALGVNMGQQVGLNHEDPLFLTDEKERLLNRINMRNAQEDVWGFKVPKSTLLLDFYEKHLRNPFYVIVYRNPVSIIDSWVQRNAGHPLSVMDRIMIYQNALFALMNKTKAPLILLNYERAVQSLATQIEAVEDIAAFLGVELTDELRDRAVGMITGDGHGYVNLPEQFFAVTPDLGDMPQGAELAMVETNQCRDADGWIVHEKITPRLIYSLGSKENLPKAFILEFAFDDGGSMPLDTDPLRIYFNFINQYTSSHCARPPIRLGHNRYLVETSGLASAVAFGPIETGTRFKLSARFYAATQTR